MFRVEERVTNLIIACQEGDHAEIAYQNRAIISDIAKLRDRIDELGGYHDDI